MRGLPQPWTRSSIIPISKGRSVWRNTKPNKQDSFLRGRQIAYLIYDYFRVTGSHDSVENFADLFTTSLRNDDIQEFDSKWDGILLMSMTKIPLDEISEGLYKLRNTRVWETQDRIGIVWPGDSSEEVRPDYHRMKTMVKRSIEQEIRNKIFGIRNGNFAKNAVVKNHGTKQRVQRIFGDCWQWESNGQCSKGDNCSFRHDINKRANPSPNSFIQQNERKSSRTRSPRGRSPSGRPSRWLCKDYLRGTCNDSFCEKWHPPECLFYKTKSGCRFGKSAHSPIVRLMNGRQKGLRRMMTKVLWLCWKREIGKKENLSLMKVTIDRGNLGREVIRNWDKIHLNVNFLMHDNWVAYFRTWSRRRLFSGSAQTCGNQSNVWNSQKAIALHTKIRDQNPSLGDICPGEPHERSPNAPKFEDRSQEETEWQEQGAPEAAWKLAKNVLKI